MPESKVAVYETQVEHTPKDKRKTGQLATIPHRNRSSGVQCSSEAQFSNGDQLVVHRQSLGDLNRMSKCVAGHKTTLNIFRRTFL